MKKAGQIRTNDRIVYKAQGHLVLNHEREVPKLGAPIVRLTLKNLRNGEVEAITFAADQEMNVY